MSQAAPVVLIPGLFGWGDERPLFGFGPDYFPLAEIHSAWRSAPVVAVNVGVGSSDHDRACEAFAQLLGTQTDYGEAHSRKYGHERFGTGTCTGRSRLPVWDATHPIHLVGHSFGGNTALTLYQLLAEDFWGRGTSSDWVLSIATICSPIHGCNFPYVLGLNEARPPGEDCRAFKRVSPMQVMCFALGILFWLQQRYPKLRGIYNFNAYHFSRLSLLECFSASNPIWSSGDNMLSEGTPCSCRRRLCSGLSHLGAVHLIAVVSGPIEPLPPAAALRAALLCAAVALSTFGFPCYVLHRQRRDLMRALQRQPVGLPAIRRPWRATLRAVLLALASSCALTAACCVPQLEGYRSALWTRLFLPMLRRCLVRPFMRLSSHFVNSAAASRPVEQGLLVGGGKACGNDGVVEMISQYGINTHTARSPRKFSQENFLRNVQSVDGLSTLPAATTIPRTYSGRIKKHERGAAGAENGVAPLERGKWHILRVPGSDHTLGTCFSMHSAGMYDALFKLLERIPQRRPFQLQLPVDTVHEQLRAQ